MQKYEPFKDILVKYHTIFGEKLEMGQTHPDREQLLLATFLTHQSCLGEASFWKPYIDVMNEADLASNWSKTELDLLKDIELEMDSELYSSEL